MINSTLLSMKWSTYLPEIEPCLHSPQKPDSLLPAAGDGSTNN